ncbi:MAG: XRE family transcriptional regulator [Chitinophagales bacterium]|nr:XRE family transcriptional regulator [Chitinophagales bacterium]
MSTRKNIKLIVEKTDTGFSAFSDKHSIYTTGTNIPELLNHAYEAVELYFEDSKAKVKKSDIKLEIDFKQFFQYYRVLNAKFLAEKIGMNPTLLSQYVSGKKKPSEKQSHKILTGIHEIGEELRGINLI